MSASPSGKDIHAVILAGGRGTRLRPFTVNFPKPLMPVGEKPILEVLMERLVAQGVTEVTLALGHMAELIKAYFDQKSEWKKRVNLRYVHETTPLGTAGALSLISGLTETFLVLNGDLLTDLEIGPLMDFHRKEQAALTVAAHQREVKIDFGVLDVDKNRRIRGYREKPVSTLEVSMGIYVYEPKVLRWVKPNVALDFPDLVLALIKDGERVCAYPTTCGWLDIGRPDDYARAQELYTQRAPVGPGPL